MYAEIDALGKVTIPIRAPDPMSVSVEIEQKTFVTAAGERREVLRDIGFVLGRGEVAVFVGPSGCGKTTMLRIIAGLDRDYRGRIVRPPGGRLGMVFEEPRLLPWRSVEDNVRLAAPDADEARLAALFAILELTQHRKHYPGELSLGLARLRDELTALVDSRPVTTLLVTHNVNDAVRLGDRIFLMSPRPAHVVAEMPIATPRTARSESEIAAIKTEIARRTNGNRTAATRDAS
jgi:NitT/TauT family transport system ATP-binding protein